MRKAIFPLRAFGILLFGMGMPLAHADCVTSARMATGYRVLDSHTIMLLQGSQPTILIKSFSFFMTNSQVSVLKDSFCDYTNAVLYVDGNTVNAQEVKQLN